MGSVSPSPRDQAHNDLNVSSNASALSVDSEGLNKIDPPPSIGTNWATRPILRLFPALQISDFRIVWQGNVATSMSYWMQQTVEGWLIYELTNSPLYLSLIALARMGPLLLLSPFAGVIADRVDRTRIVILAQLATATVVLSIAALILAGWLEPWHLLVAAAISGIMTSLHVPARQALIASLVGKNLIMSAVTLHSFALNTTRIVGPQIAGVLLSFVGPGACYIGQGCAYLWASQNLRRIKVRPPMASLNRPGVWDDIQDGIQYVAKSPQLRGVVIVGSISTMLVMPYLQFLPALVKDVYQTGPSGLAILLGAAGVGGLLGSLLTASLGNMRRKGYLLFAGSFLGAISLIGLSLSSSLLLATTIQVLAGIGTGISMVAVGALMQILASDEYRGRIGSLQIVLWGLGPVGALPMGLLAESLGVPVVIGLAGAIATILLLLTLIMQPTISRIE